MTRLYKKDIELIFITDGEDVEESNVKKNLLCTTEWPKKKIDTWQDYLKKKKIRDRINFFRLQKSRRSYT